MIMNHILKENNYKIPIPSPNQGYYLNYMVLNRKNSSQNAEPKPSYQIEEIEQDDNENEKLILRRSPTIHNHLTGLETSYHMPYNIVYKFSFPTVILSHNI
jgi:hypothetical protein